MPTVKHYCPVCGFSELSDPPADFNICPSCGTEFGYDDFAIDHQALRNRWIANGAQWFAGDEWPEPRGWNPFIQIVSAGLATSLSADAGLTIEKTEVGGHKLLPERLEMISSSGRTLAKAA
jgi:hypothetical protein